jgi:hypothetical protein
MTPIPYGTKYTITIEGFIWKPIKCERCGCEFAYRVKRVASGQGENFLWLNKKRAIDTARSLARENLLDTLDNAFEQYPCHDCGIYQRDMAKIIKYYKDYSTNNIGFMNGFGTFILMGLVLAALFPTISNGFLYL